MTPETIDVTRAVDPVAAWLLDGDPAIRWQTMRDLLDHPSFEWEATRDEVATSGWGRSLLARQDPSGTWDGGLYTPKWTSTTYTLLLLKRFGLRSGHPAALAGCRRLLDDGRWVGGGLSYWASHRYPERCVNAMVLSVSAHFGLDDPRVDDLASMLVDARLADGGWNCRDHEGDTHSSFHTTISALEALAAWSKARTTSHADDAIASGVEFLLVHRLHRSHRTGDVIDEAWLVPHFPPRWHYDVLRGLEVLAALGWDRDPRASDAVEVVCAGARPDGRWPKGPEYGGRMFFRLEPGRVPGRWNTLRARRVLRWWGT